MRVSCSSLNPIDLRMIQGYGGRLRRLLARPAFPLVVGRDVVGEVVETGAAAKRFRAGDRVVGIAGTMDPGAHAEYVAVDEINLVPAPEHVPSEELAALAYVGLTTWTALVGHLGLDPSGAGGKHLFVHAGSGGVGSFAVQWAHALGMRVTTTCGPSNVDWVRALGADRVINYRESDYGHMAGEVDYAFDTLGGEHASATAGLVRRGGGYVSVVSELMPYTDRFGVIPGLALAAGRLVRKKMWSAVSGRTFAWSVCRPSQAGLAHIVDMVANGKIRAVIERTLPMSGIVEGYRHLQSGRTRGKIVLRWNDG